VVAGGLTFRAVDAGFTHSCGITEAAEAWCWGSNAQGELGVAGTSWAGAPGSTTPVAVHGDERFVQVDAGLDFTCAVAVTSRARCWGRGFEGQLGNGALASWTTPQPVADIGDTHACGYTRANAVFCWGRGDAGQLGNPVTRVSALPVRVAGVGR
jgi:alpha-tubulin suppressor-like RCC1 family protein